MSDQTDTIDKLSATIDEMRKEMANMSAELHNLSNIFSNMSDKTSNVMSKDQGTGVLGGKGDAGESQHDTGSIDEIKELQKHPRNMVIYSIKSSLDHLRNNAIARNNPDFAILQARCERLTTCEPGEFGKEVSIVVEGILPILEDVSSDMVVGDASWTKADKAFIAMYKKWLTRLLEKLKEREAWE